jgi:SAM-dependent methyltransferase
MSSNDILISPRFPRASLYNPEWLIANASAGANTLWLTEWLTEAFELRPGMRVLDLGCGRAVSSIFLRREFGVQVWAADLWFSPAENIQRIRAAGVEDGVFPLHADARSLPFAPEFFDAIVCVDCFYYFGTDDLYLNYLANFVKLGGQIGVVGTGLTRELDGVLPEHLRGFWTQDLWCLHSAGLVAKPLGAHGDCGHRRSPIPCPTVGGFGWNGNARSPPTTPMKSTRLRLTRERTSAMREPWDAGETE